MLPLVVPTLRMPLKNMNLGKATPTKNEEHVVVFWSLSALWLWKIQSCHIYISFICFFVEVYPFRNFYVLYPTRIFPEMSGNGREPSIFRMQSVEPVKSFFALLVKAVVKWNCEKFSKSFYLCLKGQRCMPILCPLTKKLKLIHYSWGCFQQHIVMKTSNLALLLLRW